VIRTRADGSKYDANAGIRRYTEMLDEKPDLVLAFPGNRGTRHILRRAEVELMRQRYPVVYFNALVKLAQVLKIEVGPVGAFDRPATTAEALDRLEQRAGPKARAMLEQFLERVKEVEAKYREEQSAD
jgi:hypothetical protein